MAENHSSMEGRFDKLASCMEIIPTLMSGFSSALRVLYSYQAVGDDSQIANDFRRIRDDTRDDAIVFKDNIFPMTTKAVRLIDEYFDYYLALDFETWEENLNPILDTACRNEQECKSLVKVYEQLLTPLKKREDEVKVILSEMKILEKEYEENAERLRQSSDGKCMWAIPLALIPTFYINVACAPVLVLWSMKTRLDAVAQQEHANMCHAAFRIVTDTLVPVLRDFIEALGIIAGFFERIKNELTTFKNAAIRGGENPIQLHYTMMKRRAEVISGGCKNYYHILPSVRTDLDAIPTEGTDRNYVDRWLEGRMEQIQNDSYESATH